MPVDLARWTAWSELVKNGVTTLAVVVGGVWALVQFSALLEAQTASAKLQRETLEIEAARRRVAELGIVEVDIAADAAMRDGAGWRLSGAVKLVNVGSVRTRVALDPENAVVHLTRIALVDNRVVPFSPQRYALRDHLGPMREAIILPGRTLTLPFVFWTATAGLHLVTFESAISAPAAEADRGAGAGERHLLQEQAWITVEAAAP